MRFATERVSALGEGRKRRFCNEWQFYADDIAIRTGNVIDGDLYTDEEYKTTVAPANERQLARRSRRRMLT